MGFLPNEFLRNHLNIFMIPMDFKSFDKKVDPTKEEYNNNNKCVFMNMISRREINAKGLRIPVFR